MPSAGSCAAQGVEFHVRRIEEVRRGVTNRDDYERESRKIRCAGNSQDILDTTVPGQTHSPQLREPQGLLAFTTSATTHSSIRPRYDFYQAELRRAGARAVFVGHHKGDVQENIVTNVMRVRAVGGSLPHSPRDPSTAAEGSSGRLAVGCVRAHAWEGGYSVVFLGSAPELAGRRKHFTFCLRGVFRGDSARGALKSTAGFERLVDQRDERAERRERSSHLARPYPACQVRPAPRARPRPSA